MKFRQPFTLRAKESDQIGEIPIRPSPFGKKGCPKGDSARAKRAPIWMKNLRTLSIWEWLVCGVGMFFMGLGMGYIDVGVMNYGIGFFICELILEIPAFYLVFKHKKQ